MATEESGLGSSPLSSAIHEPQVIMSSKEGAPTTTTSSNQERKEADPVPGKQQLAENLVQWFIQNGGQLSTDVRVAYSQSRGYHLQAERPLSSPVVVTCPLKLTLSCLNLDSQQREVLHIDSPLLLCRGKIPQHILTCLVLIEQEKKGKASPWHAYIRCLPGPDSLTTPLWFDDQDMAFLSGTSLAPAAKERKSDYRQHWDHALSVMREASLALADEVTL